MAQDDVEVHPYGTWPSPVAAADLAAGAVRFADLQADGDDLYWIETRPADGGRQAILRWRDGALTEVTPEGWNARTRVHEYGGAAFAVRHGTVITSSFDDQRLYRIDPGGEPQPITPAPEVAAGDRYADGSWSPDGRWLLCVRERHLAGEEPRNELVAVPVDGGSAPQVVATGHDFYAAPRIRGDGALLAYLAWDHPDMPWDGAALHVARLTFDEAEGVRLDDDRHLAGGDDTSAIQPAWAPDGALVYTTDRTGFYNVERVGEADAAALTGVQADIGAPMWQLGDASFAVLDDGRVLCAMVEEAQARLALLDPATHTLTALEVPFTRISHVRSFRGGAAFLGASPQREAAVVAVTGDGAWEELRTTSSLGADPEAVASAPEAIRFPTPDGAEAHGFLYRPHHPAVRGPDDEAPPLLVLSHGGPTGNVFPVLSPAIVYWTTRGFAVVDVNYRGSTGYGRAYRDALRGNWGLHDVADCTAAARFLAERGEVDPDRLAIRGGSAGGFTTLACLVAPENPFAAGGNHFGVADLEPFVHDTHKFEARYLDRLVAPYPEGREVYRDRSPVHHADRLRTPLIVLQGAEDKMVPPEQSRAIVAAAAEHGVPHAYLEFPGEQHGFRRAEHITRALEAELFFYGAVMGFEPADEIEPVDIVNLG